MKSNIHPGSWSNASWLQTVLNDFHVPTIITDSNFRIVKWNNATIDLLDKCSDSLANKTILDILDQLCPDAEHIHKKLHHFLKTESLEEEIILKCRDGLTRRLTCFFQDMTKLDRKAKPSAIFIIIDDLKKRIEEEKSLGSFYKKLVDSLSQGVLLLQGPGGKIIAGNKKAWEILETKRDKMIGQEILNKTCKFIHEDGSPFKTNDFPASITLQTGKTVENVIMGIARAGEKQKWLSVTTSIFDHSILTDCILVSFADVSDLKLAEKRALENLSVFHSYLNSSLAPAWIFNEDGNAVFINEVARKIWKLDETYRFKNIYELFPKHIADEFIGFGKQVFKTNQPVSFAGRSIRKDGSFGFYMLHLFLLPSGDSKRLIAGQAIDITQEKEAEEALKESNERFSYVAKALSDCIWDWNMETGRIYRSEALMTLTGYTAEETKGGIDWWTKKIHPADRKRTKTKLETFIRNGEVYCEEEYRFRCADKSYKYFLDKGHIVYKGGKPVRAIGIVHDITEKRKLEARLLKQKIQKQKEVSRAIIAAQDHERNELSKELHDNVNQLLATANLFLNMPETENKNRNENVFLEKTRLYLKEAIEEIRKISKSLNSSAVEERGLFEPINSILGNLNLCQKIITDIEFDQSLEKQLSSALKIMIYRIVQEQTNNIIKYAEATKVSISIKRKENILHLEITDNGKGFDPKQSGKGIGLVNIHNRVGAFNGKLHIHSTPGNGCRLEIAIPFNV